MPVRLSPTLTGVALALAIFVFGGDWLSTATKAEDVRSVNRPTISAPHDEFPEEYTQETQELHTRAAGSSQRPEDAGDITIGDRVRQIWQRILVALDTLQSV